MKKLAISGGIIIASLAALFSLMFKIERLAIQQVVKEDTVVTVSWDDVDEMAFDYYGPVLSYTLACELRKDDDVIYRREWVEYPDDIISPGTGAYATYTLTWPIPIDRLQSGWYKEFCRLHWLADDGQQRYGYIPNEGQDGQQFFLIAQHEVDIRRLYIPVIMKVQ